MMQPRRFFNQGALILSICAIHLFPVALFAQNWSSDPNVNNPVCTATTTQTFPILVSDASGGAIVVWQDSRNGNQDVYAQRIDVSGNLLWTADGVPICTASGNQIWPELVSDGSGGAIIVWNDYRNGSSNVDVYAQRINAAGAVQWTLNGVAIATAVNDQSYAKITSDTAGGAIIAWDDTRSGAGVPHIYAQRIDTNGNPLWTANGVAVCTSVEMAGIEGVIGDGAGGAIISWTNILSLSDFSIDIYAQRVNAGGIVQWAVNGIGVCTASNDQEYPRMIPDGSGGAIFTWQDNRNTPSIDVYAQRVNASGVVQWTANGVAIGTGPGSQASPVLVGDGTGGAIIAWLDSRGGVNTDDIYAQRISAGGVPQWTANGVVVCGAANVQRESRITNDGSGGAIICWEDRRSGTDKDIYTQRMDGNGVTQWTANGVAIATAANNQGIVQSINDVANGVIMTWADFRSGTNLDIYVQKVLLNGSMSAPTAPSTLTATAVSSSQINLTWTDNATNESGFKIERSLDGVNFAEIALAGVGVTSYSNAGLSSSTQYYYRVRAYNPFGNSGYSNTADATTSAPPPVAPVAPSGLAASAISSTQIDLTWTDNASDEQGFKIERSPDGISFLQVATAPANATSYSDTGLAASTTYYYRVRAWNTAGDSGYSNTTSATTSAPPLTSPAAPTGLTASAVSSAQIDLAWTDNATDESGSKIERSADGVTFSQVATVSANVTSYSDTGLPASSMYYYRVRAWNAVGDSGYSNTASAAASSTITVLSSAGTVTNFEVLDSTTNPVFVGFKPDGVTDMYSYDVTGVSTGVSVNVTIVMTAALPAGTPWYWYNPTTSSWTLVPSDRISTTDDRTFVLTLTDGGFGDADGVANGIIVDPVGPGVMVSGGGSGGGGCYLASSGISDQDSAIAHNIMNILIIAGMLLMIYRSRRRASL